MSIPESRVKAGVVRIGDLPRSTEWLKEPDLLFAGDRTHWNPKIGIALYGPRSFRTGRHKGEVHIAFIGTGEGIDRARSFYASCAEGVDGDKDHDPFPGCKVELGFRSNLVLDPAAQEVITRTELLDLDKAKRRRVQFDLLLGLLIDKLAMLSSGRDRPLDYVAIVLPQDLYGRCGTIAYQEKGVGLVQRNLRRAFKARAMPFWPPTQIILETTTGLVPTTRQLDPPPVLAWNLFTGLYFKVDGLPWGPTELPAGTCHVGVSFFRALGESSTLRTSIAQAFDENGEGLILRGHSFPWDEQRQGKSPHLPEDLAVKLIELVLGRYRQERGGLPQRVVVHKSSEFHPGERRGFEEALRQVQTYDLVALRPNNDVRLLRTGRYPPLRGTLFRVGNMSYLYTTGYISGAERYPHGHVPSPLQVSDHVGDTPMIQLLREILVLTKMNWNSAADHALWPVTLRFSRLVGDILREVPVDETPQAKYRYYM